MQRFEVIISLSMIGIYCLVVRVIYVKSILLRLQNKLYTFYVADNRFQTDIRRNSVFAEMCTNLKKLPLRKSNTKVKLKQHSF